MIEFYFGQYFNEVHYNPIFIFHFHIIDTYEFLESCFKLI